MKIEISPVRKPMSLMATGSTSVKVLGLETIFAVVSSLTLSR